MVRGRDTRAELVQTMARLLRDQGYTATGRAQLLAESGVSNGSLYHHFPGGMEELAEAALEASGQAVADALRQALDGAPNAALGLTRFLDMAAGVLAGEPMPGRAGGSGDRPCCALISLPYEYVAQCFEQWEVLIAVESRIFQPSPPY